MARGVRSCQAVVAGMIERGLGYVCGSYQAVAVVSGQLFEVIKVGDDNA